MKRVLTVREKVLINNGLVGVIWIGMGIIPIIGVNKVLNIIAAIIGVIASSLVFIPYFLKGEKDDEMSENNKLRAKASVYRILSLVITICALITILKGELIIDLRRVLPFAIGGVNLFEFILFNIYEKVGD